MDCGGREITNTILVDRYGKGEFKTVQAAIDSIKDNNDRWVKVHINAGIYVEKVQISLYKSCVFLEGDGKDVTTITNDKNTAATFTSSPSNVIVHGITFQNSFNLVGERPMSPAMAASIYGDKSVFYKCAFMGLQDTLFDAMGRHYFKDCYIQGEVDFIYGGGQSYYEDCKIHATQGKSPPGFITAQARESEKDTSGFIFKKGFVYGSGQVNLGRAYRNYSRVIFQETYLSSVVTPEGWNSWRFNGQEYKFTYAEVNCTGPGANTSKRLWEKKLTSSELNEFSLSSFINKDGWLSNLPISFS
ncbi:putative pectinesterase 10 [Gastrolobium bilobum]|uniref:putative pectinesterase 10 n=1 Tax=Gastrolobium bilobum TaxID=150636 RepID=UPI002AB30B9C|nr:putative pectinesterase 10 [Gastrolobium bilobum]